jgi:endonuclease/exonuclease/phosphatase family metal-dependent hydrolase
MPNGESFRLATFNVENLFARYRFRANFDPVEADGFTVNNLAFRIYEEAEKRITAKAIKEVDADVICLQEVESLPVLDRFNSTFLGGRGYRHRMLIDAHDPRSIDVAVLSRFPIRAATTYRQERNAANTAFLFSRDCLDLEIAVPLADGQTRPFRLYVNHFKSMMGGREDTRARREEQVGRVVQIVNERWAGVGFQGNFAVLGDFNDFDDDETSLTAILQHPNLTDVLRASDLPEEDRWTHFFARRNDYRQLDYLFLPTPLYEASGQPAPGIMRQGMPFRAERYDGPRLDDVGEGRPKASDHAPLSVDIPKAALF